MKQRTREKALKWLETAKKMDTFSINTAPHTKEQIEDLLGIKPSKKIEKPINKDIEEERYGDMGKTHDSGYTEES
jgi:hypothetical protein